MSSSAPSIRPAAPADLAAILAIYNDVVATSDAVFTEQPRSTAEQQRWWTALAADGLPVLVSESPAGAVAGFGTYGRFRDWPGYRTTVEHSVHVDAAARRAGHGRALLTALLERATADGYHMMVAGIDGANAASVALHERFGFAPAGRLEAVATKHGRWLDLVLMQRALRPR